MTARSWGAAVALACCATTATSAAADDRDLSAAEALFARGSRAVNDGRFAEGCPDLEHARALVEGIGVTLYVGECYEHAGRLVDAWRTFHRAEELALARHDPRADVAHERAALLWPRVSGEIGTPEAATPLPQPAPPPPAGTTASPPAPPVAAVPTPSSAPSAAPPATPPPARDPHSIDPQRAAGIAVFGVGVVGVVVGAVLGIDARSKLDDSNATGHCSRNDVCDPAGLSERSSALTNATISTTAFVVGAAGMAGGAALYLLAPNPTRLGLVVTPRGEGGATIALRAPW